MDTFKIFSIEAARSLPNLSKNHPCKNVHGHSFKVKVVVRGRVNKNTGFVMDFSEIDEAFKPNISRWTSMLFERKAFKKIKDFSHDEVK